MKVKIRLAVVSVAEATVVNKRAVCYAGESFRRMEGLLELSCEPDCKPADSLVVASHFA